MKPPNRYNFILITLLFFFNAYATHSNAQDWHQYYHLPYHYDFEYTYKQEIDDSYFISAPMIKLEDLMNNQIWNNEHTTYIFLADTIILPNHDLDLGDKIFIIIAREIISPSETNFVLIDGEKNSSGAFLVLNQSMAGSIEFGVFLPNGNEQYHFYDQPDGEIGFQYYFLGEEALGEKIQDSMEALSMLSNEQIQQFNELIRLAIASYSYDHEFSLEQLSWLENLFKENSNLHKREDFSNMYLDIVGLKYFYSAQNLAKKINAQYVPNLNQELYVNVFDAAIDKMKYYQDQHERFVDHASSFDDKVSAIAALQSLHQDTNNAQQKILERTEGNIEGLLGDIHDVKERIFTQRLNLIRAETQFNIGLTKWQHDKIISGIKGGLTASMSFTKGIASVSAGDPSGSSDILDGILSAHNSSVTLANSMRSLNGMVGSLNDIESNLDALYKNLSADQQVDLITQRLQAYESIEVKTELDLMHWDEFFAEASINIQTAISKGVPGASGYLAELNKMVIFSNSLTQIKHSIAIEQAKYIDLLLKQSVDQNQVVRLQKLIEEYQNSQQGFTLLSDYFDRELEQAKRPLFLTLQHYINAYEYWSLKDSSIDLSMDMSFTDLLDYRTWIENEYNLAISGFTQAPQSFSNLGVTIDDERQLELFKLNRTIDVALPLSQPEFANLDRVRLSTVRVWLKGDNLPEGAQVTVNLKNSGVFEDRYQGQSYRFTSAATSRGFKYKHWAQLEDILIDGNVSDEFMFAYFEPTPFTQWTIELPENGLNQGIDINDVDAIELEFSGNAITDF